MSPRRIFLPPRKLAEHQSRPIPSLRLHRHYSAELARRTFLHNASWHPSTRLHTVPGRLRDLVMLANQKIPSRNPRDHICPLSLWRLIFREHFRVPPKPLTNPNHNMIYIFDRAPCPDEVGTSSHIHRRNDPSRCLLPASRTLTYTSCTFIQQPQSSGIFYGATGLSHRRHGSAHSSDLSKHRGNLVAMRIPPHVLAPPYQSANHRYFGTTKKNGVTVVGPHSAILLRFHHSFPSSLLSFQADLAKHIVHTNPQNDPARVDGKVHSHLPASNTRLTFGFTREQRVQHSKHFHLGVKLCCLNVGFFTACPRPIQDGLIHTMETATKISKHHFPGAFRDIQRTKVYATRLNNQLQHPRSSNKFEYVDIVVSHNTILPSHLDRNNDHRPGYDHTVVYTYLTKVDGKLYRVAIIMCTRTVVGANLLKIP